MNDNGGEWVESMGVVGGRGKQEVVWLERLWHKSLLLHNKNIFTY